ncbi:putative late blight resistance protein homolog R1B-17 [Olea europaea var. sylvestris]|uniref:putative late blight resistance protein homolog R1B-17 n=1 Tax=Olea europaea var. sylvestris TaxID=158386 RepID=UPI000C1D00F4|nr:putative late blight resistance protein homolog R1B-17 [Olea europaea var. sylvestris]
MGFSYENLSLLVTSPDLLSHLQDLKLDGGEKLVNFQWLGPHFLAFLKYAKELHEDLIIPEGNDFSPRFIDLLKCLDDAASNCILYGETEHYKNFLEIILSFMPYIKKLFTLQNTLEFECNGYGDPHYVLRESFINFLYETIGELLNCETYSSVLVSNQVKVLWKELKFLLTFFVDTMQYTSEMEQQQIEQMFEGNTITEIGHVYDTVGVFLHKLFFTTDHVTTTEMDEPIFLLLKRIASVQKEIKNHYIEVSMKLTCGNGSLQIAESQSEVSSSQHKNIPMAEEMIVGFEDVTTQIASKILGGPSYRQIISIVGMGGLGKTSLAKKVYNDSNVRNYFDMLSWCVVSQTYKKRKLLIDILSSGTNLNREELSKKEDEELAELLYKNLKGRRYLIVIDDLWDKEAWDDLKRLFPEDKNGSRVLFTSRQKNVALEISQVILEPPLMSPGESWNLLEQNLFKSDRCPQELQDIGKQIATNCHGLPLSVVTIAGVLSNMEKKESLWQDVAKSLSSYISQKADDYLPTLKLSYMHLPNHLKPCFLYLSAFQEDEEIWVKKLLLFWIAEGFIEKKEHKSLEDIAEEYLVELIDRSLLQVATRRSNNGVNACTLHDLVLDMCRKMAVEDETFLFQHQFLISKLRHRLCMDRVSPALSILYNSEKVRIFDQRYYSSILLGIKIMPDLRYLAIPSLDSTISRLQNLEVLRVGVKRIPAYLLSMPKLRHLDVGTFETHAKFSKNCDCSQINSLQTLFHVRIGNSKHEEILRCSPNLLALKCKSSNNFVPNFNFPSQLQSLTFIGHEFKIDYSGVNFPKNIKKLSLSSLFLPWEKMSLIGTLPNLEILKLGSRSYEGEIWSTKDDEFQKLKFLRLCNLDLEEWNSSHDHFPVLERLVLYFCKNLDKIPPEFSNILTLQKIEVDYCGENVGSSALKIREEQQDYGNEEFEVTISNERMTGKDFEFSTRNWASNPLYQSQLQGGSMAELGISESFKTII